MNEILNDICYVSILYKVIYVTKYYLTYQYLKIYKLKKN